LNISKQYVSLHLTEHYAIQICGEVELKVNTLLNSVSVGIESDKL